MSAETTDWLNTYTLQSRAAWHTSAALQKLRGTVYNGPIPVEDVATRLFDWEPLEAKITAQATHIDLEGVTNIEISGGDTYKAILRPPAALSPEDAGAILGIFKSGYRAHPYRRWLLENVADLLDDDLGIYSAGLLRGGAQAWVQVSVPETVTTPEGVTFRPNLLATTSLDGSLATSYKRTIQNTVCDNSMAVALSEISQTYKVRHSRYSEMKLMEARDALDLIHTIADDFTAQVAELCATTVTDAQFDRFLAELAPTTDPKTGEEKSPRGVTIANAKRSELRRMWENDDRVSPWRGSAWGVVQAVNTHAQHVAGGVRGDRDERNMSATLSGDWEKLDRHTVDTLREVIAA